MVQFTVHLVNYSTNYISVFSALLMLSPQFYPLDGCPARAAIHKYASVLSNHHRP
jgi:hypothetical protein